MTNYHDPKYGWPTTRCYPRSMTEAFQQDHDQWWYPPERSVGEYLGLCLSGLFFVSTLLFVLGTS